MTPIEILHLPERTYNALLYAGIETIEQLTEYSGGDLRQLWYIGDASIRAINDALTVQGLSLRICQAKDANSLAFLANMSDT